MAKVVLESAPIVKPKTSHDDWIMRLYMAIIGLNLLVSLAFPLYVMLVKSFYNYEGAFIGLANYLEYFSTPALFASIYNSLCVSVITTLITICLAFIYAYALQRQGI
jgi:iron(III) transport system permease protein